MQPLTEKVPPWAVFATAIQAAIPLRLVPDHRSGPPRRTIAVGAGKASAAMGRVAEAFLPNPDEMPEPGTLRTAQARRHRGQDAVWRLGQHQLADGHQRVTATSRTERTG